ncbi:MAG: TatD family hydrolase [Planctomycetes bacterium]|nr:TatD family hydrolase [Planctomycetota bacterium]
MIDTHCHLTFDQFAGRVDRVLEDARAVGVRGAITVSTTSENCRAGLELAQQHEQVWCTAGAHPLYADEPCDWAVVREVAQHPKCVAWGELGLDNHYDKPLRSAQDTLLERQLAFIESCSNEGITKPIVVHCRKAVGDLLPIFRAAPFDPSRYVFHCFSETVDNAKEILDFGAWISFTGIVTFKNAAEVAEAAKLVPGDRIMVETDAPFLSPEPVRKMYPNEPKNVVHTARFIAKLRGVDPVDFERQLDANAERFFGIELGSSSPQSTV